MTQYNLTVKDGVYTFTPVADVPPAVTLPIGARGIDVSHYQGAIDWGKVKAAGIQFAFIKVTESTNVTDGTFRQNWQGAKAVGIPRGAYHFYRCAADPIAQADYFLQQLGSDIGELQPVLDAEDMSAKPNGDDLRRFCEHIAQTIGARPIIYTGRWWWNDPRYLVERQAWAGTYKLWLAAYVPQAAVNQYIPPDWRMLSYWQSGQGTVNGITGAVDLDMVMA